MSADDPNPNTAKDRAFGELNDVSAPTIQKRLHIQKDHTIGAMARAARDTYIPNALANVGQFKGVVLRVVMGPETTSQDGQPAVQEQGGWFTSFYGEGEEGLGTLVEIKVRVPEVHSMLPIPSMLGEQAKDTPDAAIIEMYPTFIAQSMAVQVPEAGDLVWVDWGNRQNWTDPYYVRPVKEIAVGGALGGAGAAGAHTNCSGGGYSAKGPVGDSVAGKNTPLAAHTGLPRLKRIQKPSGTPVLLTSLKHEETNPATKATMPVYPATTAQWKKTVEKQLPPGRSWIGICASQGMDDTEFDDSKASRSNIIWYSNSTDFKQPWELMYFFHGLNEFTGKTFEKQIAPQISTAVSQGRNFVLVMPELPWSKAFGGKRQKGAFRPGSTSFKKYHTEILNNIKLITGNSKAVTPSFISICAHSAGGGALQNAANDKSLNKIKPNKLFLSDCDYMGATKAVWNNYAKAETNVWMTSLTTSGKTRKNTEAVFNSMSADDKKRELYHIKTKKSHFACGANSMITVSDESIERQKVKDSKKAEEAKAAPPSDDQGEENKVAAESIEKTPPKSDIEALPKKDPSGTSPPVQTPPTSASKQSKESGTAKKPTFKSTAAIPYEENRVKVKEYGGSLVGAASDKLLEEVEPGVKLHKLVAVRYRAFKKAAIAAGFTKFKISSGWRRHRWKDRAHYEATLRTKYGSVDAGKGWLAFESPHEMGMAMDVKAHGVYASSGGSKTTGAQRKTKLFAWMKEHAHEFGLTPYKKEPWHWECRLPYDSYASGEEFAQDLATRVTYIGGKNAQLPSGPSTGGSRTAKGGAAGGGGGGKRCVQTGGGGAIGGAYVPGTVYKVSGGGGLGKQLKEGPPPRNSDVWGEPKRLIKDLKCYVVHETAGWPNRHSGTFGYLKNLKDKVNPNGSITPAHKRVVTYWCTIEGDVIQLCPPNQRTPHANGSNGFSVGIEVSGFANAAADYSATWQRKLAMGMHLVTAKGKGDIQVEPGMVVPTAMSNQTHQLSTLAQCESSWKLAVWLAKVYKPAGSKKSFKIAFPCVPDKDKFWWSKWNGEPVTSKHAAACSKWFAANEPIGIVSHARIKTHHDGLPLEYYALARATGMSPKNAYWAMVGALCSGTRKGNLAWTPTPNAKMVAIGKKKYPSAWFTQKTSKLVGKKKWAEIAPANPQWFADPKYQALAGTKGHR